MRPIIFLEGVGTIWTKCGAGLARTALMARSETTGGRGGVSVRTVHPHAADKDAIKALNHVCKKTSALVVIIGAWRVCESGPNLEASLSNEGVTAQLHNDWRTDGDGPSVAKEIERWLKAHPGIPGFAVVTPQPLEISPTLKDRDVRPADHNGITGQAADIAAAIDATSRAAILEQWSIADAQELRRAVGR